MASATRLHSAASLQGHGLGSCTCFRSACADACLMIMQRVMCHAPKHMVSRSLALPGSQAFQLLKKPPFVLFSDFGNCCRGGHHHAGVHSAHA